MHFITAIALLAASCPLAFAAPGQSAVSNSDWQTLRLVKTSEADPGQWVDENDLFSKFTAKGVNFVDITDIKVSLIYMLDLTYPAYIDTYLPWTTGRSSSGYSVWKEPRPSDPSHVS